MLGVALLAGLTLGSVAVARGRGFSCARIALDMVGAIVGAGVGAIPGAGLGIGPLITVSVEGGANVVVPLALLAVGGAAGGLVGMLLADRPLASQRPPRWTWIAALAGLAVGVAACFSAILLSQETAGELAVFLLMPLCSAAAMVAAYSAAAASSLIKDR
jgi:CDP-diglyceride synthetase